MTRLLSTIVPAGAGIALLGIVATTQVTAGIFVLPTENGDVNGSQAVDISDAVYLLQHLFRGGPEPMPLACEPDVLFHNGDVNGSNEIDISDVVYMLDWLFRGGPVPDPGCPVPGP